MNLESNSDWIALLAIRQYEAECEFELRSEAIRDTGLDTTEWGCDDWDELCFACLCDAGLA